ncbi:MAG: archease [Candidatus Omnitrophica bacterium]|nr:archease [Candidatus Omnitrophota bacterium]
MGNKYYEVLEHTADIGLRIKGSNLEDLFKNAGLSIFQVSCRKQFTKNKEHKALSVKLNAETLEDLFINWLNELLSLSSANGLIFHRIEIDKIGNNAISASCVGSSIENYKVNIEIKAATYHRLKIKEDKGIWQAEVILDV